VDTQPPIIRLANIPEDLKVREEELLIEGVTEPNVTLWFNDELQSVPVDRGGGFSLRHHLREEKNRIELVAVDQAGNKASIAREVTLILKPPEIVVTVPPDGLWINQKMLTVQGYVSPGTALRVNGKEASIDVEGNFAIDVLLQEGENQITLEVTDEVGNVTTARRRAFLKTRPPALVLSSAQEGMVIHDPSLLITGRTDARARVTLNGQELAVDSRGGFQGLINLVEGENLITAEAVDQAGNVTTLTHRVTYAPHTGTPGPPLPVVLPVAATGAALSLLFWLLLGGWFKPVSLSLSASNHVLYPNQGNSEIILSLKVSRSAWVTVDIWNQKDDLVTSLLYRRRRGKGEHFLIWDGRDKHIQTVSDGTYEVEATASTLINAVSTSVQIQVDTSAPRLPARLQQFQDSHGTTNPSTVSR
jgi:flagellar hook assembly protein FlgD